MPNAECRTRKQSELATVFFSLESRDDTTAVS